MIAIDGNQIILTHEEGESVGSSFSNPYKMAHLVAESQNWEVPIQQIEEVFIIPYSIYVKDGAYFAVYHSEYNIVLNFNSNITTYNYQLRCSDNGHIKIGLDHDTHKVRTVTIMIDNNIPTAYRRVYLKGDVNVFNTMFYKFYNGYILGDEEYQAYIENSSAFNTKFGFSFNAFTDIKNCNFVGGYYGLQLGAANTSENILIDRHARGLLISSAYARMKNVKISRCTSSDTYVRFGNSSNRVAEFVDSQIEKDRMAFYTSGTTPTAYSVQKLISTFSLQLKDDDCNVIENAAMTVYSKDSEKLFQAYTDQNGEIPEAFVEYYSKYRKRLLDGTIEGGEKDHEPLRVEVLKDGYEISIIEGIFVIPGVPTVLRMVINEVEPKIYINHNLSGDLDAAKQLEGEITKSVVRGEISNTTLKGVISQKTIKTNIKQQDYDTKN